LTSLTVSDFRKIQLDHLFHNFATPGAFFRDDPNTGLVYGTIKVTLLNVSTGKAQLGAKNGLLDIYNFEYHPRRYMRNVATWLGRIVAGQGTPYKIYGHGYGIVWE